MSEKHIVSVMLGDKESIREFDTLEEAWGFVPQALQLKEKAPSLKIKVRKKFSSEEVIEPHWGAARRDEKGIIKTNPFSGLPLRDLLRFGKKGKEWYCPVDGFYVQFQHDSYYGLKRCPHCGMSENDWYVKSINGLWKELSKTS